MHDIFAQTSDKRLFPAVCLPGSLSSRPNPAPDRQTSSMKRLLDEPNTLEQLLMPETALEKQLLKTPEFRHGLIWGEPRFGHPEGKVGFHVKEVLENIDRIPNLSETMRAQLRLIAFTHDTFKYAEDRSRPRDWSKHHGILARRFLEPYTTDTAVLDVIETHDDAYYVWLASRHEEPWADKKIRSLENLFVRVGYCRQLYYLFFKCDTQTGDKTQAPLKWFEKTAWGIENVPIAEF